MTEAVIDPFAVPRWPELACRDGIWLAAVDTPETPIRDSARQRVRAAVEQAVRRIPTGAALIGARAAPLVWHDSPGTPLRLALPGAAGWGFAISHEIGLSLFAVRPAGPVGIDLLRREAIPADAAERCRLARDYLGDAARGADATAFARAWVRHEAALKCRGLALGEWSPALARELTGVAGAELALPAGFIGAVAWPE